MSYYFHHVHRESTMMLQIRNTRIPYVFTPKRMKTLSSHEWKKNELKDGTSEGEAVQTCQTSLNVPFSKAFRGVFFQDKPCLNNVYHEDSSLRDYLQRLIPTKVTNIHLYTLSGKILE